MVKWSLGVVRLTSVEFRITSLCTHALACIRLIHKLNCEIEHRFQQRFTAQASSVDIPPAEDFQITMTFVCDSGIFFRRDFHSGGLLRIANISPLS